VCGGVLCVLCVCVGMLCGGSAVCFVCVCVCVGVLCVVRVWCVVCVGVLWGVFGCAVWVCGVWVFAWVCCVVGVVCVGEGCAYVYLFQCTHITALCAQFHISWIATCLW
jgi:hypothetical protein